MRRRAITALHLCRPGHDTRAAAPEPGDGGGFERPERSTCRTDTESSVYTAAVAWST